MKGEGHEVEVETSPQRGMYLPLKARGTMRDPRDPCLAGREDPGHTEGTKALVLKVARGGQEQMTRFVN